MLLAQFLEIDCVRRLKSEHRRFSTTWLRETNLLFPNTLKNNDDYHIKNYLDQNR